MIDTCQIFVNHILKTFCTLERFEKMILKGTLNCCVRFSWKYVFVKQVIFVNFSKKAPFVTVLLTLLRAKKYKIFLKSVYVSENVEKISLSLTCELSKLNFFRFLRLHFFSMIFSIQKTLSGKGESEQNLWYFSTNGILY